MDTGDIFTMREVMLRRLKFAVSRTWTMEYLQAAPEVQVDHRLNRLVSSLHTDILAETLPPRDCRIMTTVQRHASWWDTFKATHRGRWWWPRVLARVSYVDVPVYATFNVRDHWTFPEATILQDSEGLGRPVMVSMWEMVMDDELS
jgi:hypothetical protein